MKKLPMFLLCVASLALAAVSAGAATTEPANTLKVDYFSNANTAGAPDATLRITNGGASGGNLCAALYVFDSNQELSECCSCLITPNGMQTLSVNTNLTAQPLTGVVLTTGSIRIVSSSTVGGSCPLPIIGKLTPTLGLRAWSTHIQNGFAVTEGASQDATFSSSELTALENECYAIYLGTSFGQCTCGTGD